MKEEPTSPFLCLDAIKCLPNGTNLLSKISRAEEVKHLKFTEFLKKEAYCLEELQPYMTCQFMVIQCMQRKHWMLLYDGRHYKNNNSDLQLVVWLLDKNGMLFDIKSDILSCPKLDSNNYQSALKEKNLWQLLGLHQPEPNPVNYEETMAFLRRHNKECSINLYVLFYPGKKSDGHFWTYNELVNKTIHVFTKPDYSLGFRAPPPYKKKSIKINTIREIKEPCPVPINEKQNNRSSAVSNKLSGLNLAFALGCVSKLQLKYLSAELGKCCASLWMEYDNLKSVRYISCSVADKLLQIEVINENSWTHVFEFILKHHELIKKKKEKLLRPILSLLQTFSQDISSPFKKCLTHITDCIKHLKVIVFSEDDTALHSVKMYLACFLKNRNGKKFRGVTLNANSKNDLVLLRTKEMTIFNLNVYLTTTVLPSNVLPTPQIKSTIKDLHHQSKDPTTNLTVLAQCKKRGKQIVQTLLACWQNVGKFFMDEFELDIFSLPFVTLSSLAFQAVWTKYSRQAGIYHHAIEKTKTAYGVILRSYSHGGYSFSCEDKLNVGQPLHGAEGNPAATILELDIISSYGFGGAHIRTPKGFCNGYSNNGNDELVRCDTVARHQTFEFLSVFYTIWLLEQNNFNIKTVFSNFHQNGVFYVGHFPVDLTVIFDDGKIAMFQFDGDYAHGCRGGCRPLHSYVHGKTREEVEKNSEKRDTILQDWVQHINTAKQCSNFITYSVKTSCHHDDYKMTALKKTFDMIPLLSKLTEGYQTKASINKDEVLFCNEDLTYILIADGYIPCLQERPPPLNALIIQNEDKKWKRCNSTKTTNRAMLLTRDYVEWLVKYFNFQITKIHYVFFYKTCTVLNSIFQHLTGLRMTPDILPNNKQLLKNVINYTAGYFGLNENKSTTAKNTLVCNAGSYFNLKQHNIEYMGSIGKEDFYIKTFYKLRPTKQRMGFAPLPIFVSIVEFGKLRISQVLCFFDKFLDSASYRHLYTNVDNVVIVLSTETIEDAVKPALQTKYQYEKLNYFIKDMPGHLKEEFKISADQDWRFVSPMTMNYSILTRDSKFSVHKNSAVNGVSTIASYEMGLKLLSKQPFEISQVRRENKILNKKKRNVTYVYNKVNSSPI
jgi:hypothetical protein